MFIVRNCFTAKPGQAGRLANMFKAAAAAAPIPNHRVLTDVIGGFNTVVLEFEVSSLAEFESTQRDYTTNPIFREKLAGYTDLWSAGHREILKMV